jgi:hypothetical protein
LDFRPRLTSERAITQARENVYIATITGRAFSHDIGIFPADL